MLLQVVAALSCACEATGAGSHPEGGDGSGVFVRLEFPWATVSTAERIQYQYILENASDKPIPVAIPSVKHGFGLPAGGQPFLEVRTRSSGRKLPELAVQKAQWPPIGRFGNSMEAWGELPPGQRITWNQNRLWADHFGLHAYEPLETVQAHWLVGPNRWISSEWVPVRTLTVPRSEITNVFEARWSSYGFGKDSCQATAYTMPVEDRLFLYFERVRVTEVAPGDEFEHQIDRDGTNMGITIKNAAGSRKVYFHLRHGLTRDTPWPIGPVKLFYPKPEPIPPAELKALRKRMVDLGDASSGTQPVVESPEPETPSRAVESAEAPPRTGSNRWLWLVVGVVVLLGAAMFMVRRKGR